MKLTTHKNTKNNEKDENNKKSEKKKEKLHGKCSERDCLAKQEILKPLVNMELTSAELYAVSDYKGDYSSLRSHLSRYVKRGYVKKYGRKRPFQYQLTDYGKEVCIDNPFGYREERVRIHNEKKKLRENNLREKYGSGVVQVVGGSDGGYSDVYSGDGGYSEGVRDFGNDSGIVKTVKEEKPDNMLEDVDEYKAKRVTVGDIPVEKKEEVETKVDEQQTPDVTPEKDEKDAEYWKNLCYKLDGNYKNYIKEMLEYMNKNGIKNLEKIMKDKNRIENRRKLAEQYRDQYLDSYFFNQWNMYPARVKGSKAWKKGDVEILSKNNAEFSRGHIKHVLNEEQIYNGGFAIVKYVNNGIHVRDVRGNCMKEAKLMKY